MSNEKKERVMGPKGFLHKASGKISAEAFLAQHRTWLETGELANMTSPILNKLDKGEVLPSPALESIKHVVYAHMLNVEVRKNEEAMAKRVMQSEKVSKEWVATCYDKDGQVLIRTKENGEEEEVLKDFNMGSEADRWVDRRLFDGPPDCFGVVKHTTLKNSNGEPLSSVILRGDAMARILKEKRGPVIKKLSPASSSLSFGVKAVQSHCHFSKG